MGKCKTIFSLLFGVSFYLILRKREYPSGKFVFRCLLLIMIGLINKLFYTYDVLMLYGFVGIILILFRFASKSKIYIFISIFAVIYTLEIYFSLGDYIYSGAYNTCYSNSANLVSIILSTPHCFNEYLAVELNNGIVGCLFYFMIRYYIARTYSLGNLCAELPIRFICTTAAIFIITYIMHNKMPEWLYRPLNYTSGGLFYSSVIIKLYNSNMARKFLSLLEPYGKLGLTNYTVGSVIGVLLFAIYPTLRGLHSYVIVLIFIIIYILQLGFSTLWVRYNKYGPLEGVWRKATKL